MLRSATSVYPTAWGGASLANGTARQSPSPGPIVPFGAKTAASHALRARHGFHVRVHVVGAAQAQIGQLIERQNALLTLALQEATKTPIVGWCHDK